MVKIDKRRKYFLAVMVVLLLAGIFYRFWPQLSNIRISDDDIAVKKKQLEKYRQLVQSGGDLEKEVARLQETLKKAEKVKGNLVGMKVNKSGGILIAAASGIYYSGGEAEWTPVLETKGEIVSFAGSKKRIYAIEKTSPTKSELWISKNSGNSSSFLKQSSP